MTDRADQAELVERQGAQAVHQPADLHDAGLKLPLDLAEYAVRPPPRHRRRAGRARPPPASSSPPGRGQGHRATHGSAGVAPPPLSARDGPGSAAAQWSSAPCAQRHWPGARGRSTGGGRRLRTPRRARAGRASASRSSRSGRSRAAAAAHPRDAHAQQWTRRCRRPSARSPRKAGAAPGRPSGPRPAAPWPARAWPPTFGPTGRSLRTAGRGARTTNGSPGAAGARGAGEIGQRLDQWRSGRSQNLPARETLRPAARPWPRTG